MLIGTDYTDYDMDIFSDSTKPYSIFSDIDEIMNTNKTLMDKNYLIQKNIETIKKHNEKLIKKDKERNLKFKNFSKIKKLNETLKSKNQILEITIKRLKDQILQENRLRLEALTQNKMLLKHKLELIDNVNDLIEHIKELSK